MMTATPDTIDFTHPAFDTTNQWRNRAACPNHPEANWFPEQHHARDTAVENAYTICRTQCPVRWDCLRFALITDRHRDRGIFGGLGPRARARLRNQLVNTGRLPVIRICANPACRREFPAKPTTPRDNVCCSNPCRLVRRRLMARFAKGTPINLPTRRQLEQHLGEEA
jgi:hypothetical protein